MNWFKLKACVKCRGDLVWDDGDWLCMQCGRYYYTRLYESQAIPDWRWSPGSETGTEPREEKAAVLRPMLAHGYRAVQSGPLATSPLVSGTASTAAEVPVGGIVFASLSPAQE